MKYDFIHSFLKVNNFKSFNRSDPTKDKLNNILFCQQITTTFLDTRPHFNSFFLVGDFYTQLCFFPWISFNDHRYNPQEKISIQFELQWSQS